MDRFLINYLRSGRAWVLVGSGPSIEMGYPSWAKLALNAINTVKAERPAYAIRTLEAALHHEDFPEVFEEAVRVLGAPRLLQALQTNLNPSRSGDIYRIIARWPVPVYLTTNYDDEIQIRLAEVREAYLQYSNSEEHMGLLLPDLNGAVIKLHGDLRSEKGLILSRSQYQAISGAPGWQYWRTKMTSIFQMTPVVVIGHSLTDPNIRHVLEAAKSGAGVHQPICWIAPNLEFEESREYLERYRIRAIGYDNRDGDHANLRRLLEHISDFVPPRTAIRLEPRFVPLLHSPLQESAAAPAFFVFNKLASQIDSDQKRVEIVLAAIQAALPGLEGRKTFSLIEALEVAGWPKGTPLPEDLARDVGEIALVQGLLVRQEDRFALGTQALAVALENRTKFVHVRGRFIDSLVLRLRREFPGLPEEAARLLAKDVEASLTAYFREGGLTLASMLFSTKVAGEDYTIPTSVLKFIGEASAKYDTLLERQAFSTVSIEAFTKAGSAEREYLGRIAQGFFAFHAMGAFGEVAVERLSQASSSVWLIDSNVQISALAIGSRTTQAWRDCLTQLKASKIRLFTTERLFDETREHWWFANRMVREYGPTSKEIVNAAMGEPPFRRSNLFLEGFVRWQAGGNPANWEDYLFQLFRTRDPNTGDIRRRLIEIGVEVIGFQDWPGFAEGDFVTRDENTQKIASFRRRKERAPEGFIEDQVRDPYGKAEPEAEALIIVRKERSGNYRILSEDGERSPSWFVSDTSILNAMGDSLRITWQPEAFLRFASTLFPVTGTAAAESAFDTLLWGIAQSGISLVEEKAAEAVLGGVIDQAALEMEEMRQIYEKTLAEKYGEPLETVMARVDPVDRPLAAIQLANEISQAQEARAARAEAAASSEARRAKILEQQLKDVERYRRKMEEKRGRGRRKAKKQRAKSIKKRR